MAALSRDEAEQQNQLEVLRAAAEGRAEQPLHFCWFEAAATWAGQQFAARLGLDGGQAPALVAVAPKKERSAVMTGRFEKVRRKARQAMSADAPPCVMYGCACVRLQNTVCRAYVCLLGLHCKLVGRPTVGQGPHRAHAAVARISGSRFRRCRRWPGGR